MTRSRRLTLVLALTLVFGLMATAPVVATSTTPLDEGGWVLVAHMSNSDGMFDGDGDLRNDYSAGNFVADPTATTPDFQRAFPVHAEEIMFITGDHSVWAVADYGDLRTVIDARGGDSSPNLDFKVGVNGDVTNTTGNVLSRDGNLEDPWITIDGSHSDGLSNHRIVWGEANWGPGSQHAALKDNHGGINVYVKGNTSPLNDGGWDLVAHMGGSGGMFDGNGELHHGYSYGTFVANPMATTPDFQRAFPVYAEEILFITGDQSVWAVTDYTELRAVIDARGSQFTPNLAFEVGANGVVTNTTGNVLSRDGSGEDPWISIYGGHLDGVANGRIVWGENDWGGPGSGHVALKNGHGGINVYVKGRDTNAAPSSHVGGPYLVAAGDSLVFDGSGSSDPDGDSLTETWTAGGGTVTNARYAAGGTAGIYDVCLTVNDAFVDSPADCTFVVVYDATAGFVTGGGSIESPAGAYVADPSASGRAHFGFVARYKKGANVPSGNTEFQFHAGDLNFHSTSYDWLVVAGSDRAKFKGVGTINGAGNYGFMLTAVDNGQGGDTFRIKIWDKDDGDAVVYDNQIGDGDDAYTGTAVQGSIKVHRR
jgi:hypothetical protein